MRKFFEQWANGLTAIYSIAALSLILRCIAAFSLELGNDEVYYVTYAQYPQLSFFDHPPLVGVLIWLGTLGNTWNHEIFIRLFPLLLGTANLFVVYRIILLFADRKAAIAGALLGFSSIYVSIIAGLFIMPDTAMLFFLFLALYQLVCITHHSDLAPKRWMLFGLFCGLGFLAKVHILFLWGGLGVFALCYQRSWLKSKGIYLGFLVTVLCTLPVIWWNAQHEFISFMFQGDRVTGDDGAWHWDWLLRELGGNVAYNNPVVFGAIVTTVICILRHRVISRKLDRLFACLALPLILVFLGVSLKHETLPHWSAPAYSILIIPAGVLFAKRVYVLVAAFSLSLLVLTLGPILVQFVSFDHQNTHPTGVGRFDFTLDMYGWHEIGRGFQDVRLYALKEGLIQKDAKLIITKWFPGGHLVKYVAEPNSLDYYGVGSLSDLHHFYFINEKKERPAVHDWHYFVTTSHFYQNPQENPAFLQYQLIRVFPIYKMDQVVENVFVYRVRLKGAFDLQGHRGCRGWLPENSIAGFERALELGVTSLELDCVITADSVVVVSHDPEILPSLCEVDKPRRIYNMTLKEVQSYRCGTIPQVRFPQQQMLETVIPTLEEVILRAEEYSTVLQRSKPFYNIEIKSTLNGVGVLHSSHREFARLIIDVVERMNVSERCVIQSFDPEALRQTRNMRSNLRTALLVEDEPSPAAAVSELGYIPSIYSPNFVLVNDSVVRYCKKNNIELIPWTVNGVEERKELLELGVDGIITDFP
jgi:glycerophosphoryl diester phosphodiesterase